MAFLGHALMENHHGLLMDFTVSLATGMAEREGVPTGTPVCQRRSAWLAPETQARDR